MLDSPAAKTVRDRLLATILPSLRPSVCFAFLLLATGVFLWVEPAFAQSGDPRWFIAERKYLLIIMLLLCAAILYYTMRANQGANYFVRKIAGIDAIEEAVGRATEMGKAVLY
ncbi:MAG: hypothetical protein HKN21_16900, partial [Candidatus Eisenbacteria bacterium]|nr:hypothetical protein [Candidatus Eisenbacteria bacterium]